MSNTKQVDHSREARVSQNKTYQVHLLSGLSDDLPNELCAQLRGRRSLLVTTPSVAALYAKDFCARLETVGMEPALLVLDCNEPNKNMAQVETIARACYRHALDREAVLIGMGGGVCTDLVTMAASMVRRGIRTLRVPTTLIGQIDASIGIKGAVNFDGRKNGLGCFYPPSAVLIDPAFLVTLPEILLRDGFAEIIKIAMVRDARLMELVAHHGPSLLANSFREEPQAATEIIWRAVARMVEELESNFYENRSYQRMVDFGHVFSPSIESQSGYSITHGQAVSLDMVYSCALAHLLGILEKQHLTRLTNLLSSLGLPVNSPLVTDQLLAEALDESILHRGGKVNLVAPKRPGEAVFVSERGCFTPALIAQARTLVSQLTDEVQISSCALPKHPVFDIRGSILHPDRLA